MSLLLDTHVALWLLADDPRLGRSARGRCTSGEVVNLSVASVWEVAIKHARGRLGPPREFLEAATAARLRLLDIGVEHVVAAGESAFPQGDPFDRLLVAQARVEGLTLLTSDRLILGAGLPDVVDAGD